MASRSPETTRNIALCGHGTCGKTTLVESLLHKGGSISRMGTVGDGSTVCDFDPLEKERQHTIDLSCAHLEKGGVTVNLIDTPGYRDFVGQVYCAATAVETMVVVVDADEGVRPNTRKVWEIAGQMNLPRIVVINRIDREQAKQDDVLEQLREQLSGKCVPMTLPDSTGSSVTAVERTFGNASASDAAKAVADQLVELVVESNDDLMERYLSGEEIAPEEIDAQFQEALVQGQVYPVYFTAGEKGIGVEELLADIIKYCPPASNALNRTVHPPASGEESEDVVETSPLSTGADDPLCAYVFRVASDPYVGKLSYLRLFSGSLVQNGSFHNPHTGKNDKVGKIVRMQGKEQEGIEEAAAGDIVGLVKVEGLQAFDLLTAEKHLVMDPPKLPTPMFSRAVKPKSKADEKRFAEAITKVIDEDVMIRSSRDTSTNEMVVSGISQLHLQVVWERLKSRSGVEVETSEPKTPYLETITGKAAGVYRHKKQSGGAGEFAEVHLRIEPLERGSDVEFVNSVFGGAISQGYVQSAEKGIRASLTKGVVAGYPVVDVKIDIYDGKEHPVDSKDIAFQKAGREAFRIAMKDARPVLLEPIVNLEVTFPSESMGDVQGDLNRRRGRVGGMDALGAFQVVRAQVPLAELGDYSSTLDSMTGGQGTYAIEMSHYDLVPANIQQKVSAAAKTEAAKEGD